MNARDHARMLLKSGLTLRRLRSAFEAEVFRQAEVRLYGERLYGKRSMTDIGEVLKLNARGARAMSRRIRSASTLHSPFKNSLDALIRIHSQALGLEYRKLQAAFDRDLTNAAIEMSREQGVRRPQNTGAQGAARMLGIHRNLIPRILARTVTLRSEVR